MGWLHSSPKRDKKSESKSRMDEYREQSPEHHRLIMPECQAAWMLELINKLGMCQSGMNGPQRQSWQEVKAFSDLSGCLNKWESDTLMQMSADYVSWYHKGSDPGCPPPFELNSEDAVQARRKMVSEQLASMKSARKQPR